MNLRSVALVGVAAVLAAGCQMSQVDPEADVAITGSLMGSDEEPIGGTDIVLLTEPTVGDVLFGLPFGLGSLGFACLVEDPPPPCDTRRRVTTDGDGGFAFTVKGRETQGLFGDAARMTISGGAPAHDRAVSGPAVTGAFVVRDERVILEPLTAARAGLSLSASDGRAHVAWAWQGSTLRGVPGTAELVFQDGVAPTWVVPASGTGIDLRVLEEPSGTVSVIEQRRAEGTIDELTYRSELMAYVSGAGAPVSRGAACSVVSATGDRVPVAPCPVTDGDLAERSSASLACDDPACRDATGFEIDLGSPRAVELLVVRGCEDACPLEVSADGSTWQLLSEVAGPYVTVEGAGAPVRYVRVTGDTGVHGVAELSVWDGPASEERFELAPVAASGAEGGSGASDGPARDSGWLLWLAAALVVLAAVAVGVAIGRRSQPVG